MCQQVILCHVPAELAAKKGLTAKEWVDKVLVPVGGKVISEEGDFVKAEAAGDKEAVRIRVDVSVCCVGGRVWLR